MQTSDDPRNPKLCVDRVLPRDMARRQQLLTAPRTRGERPRPRLAIVGVKRWDTGRTLRVSFLDGEPEVHQKVEHYARQWNPYANIGFEFGDFDDAEIRISFLHPGSWSYIGVDAKAIDPPEPTMNYGWLYPETADDEYRRVVLHEFGHALGAIHEHSSPGVAIPWNKQAVYDSYTGPPNNWTREQVDINLFKLYEEDVTQYSAFDPESIMLYPIPNTLTEGDWEVGWNRDLSETDKDWMRLTYPGAIAPQNVLVLDGQPTAASIGVHGERDEFRFEIDRPGRYIVETLGSSDVVMELLRADQPEVVIATDDDSGDRLNPRIDVSLEPGAFLARVSHYWPSGTGDYSISLTSG